MRLRTSLLDRRALFMIIVCSMVAVSCSSDGDDGVSSTSVGTGSSTFPRTVTTALGEVTIVEPPTRVVALGNVDADIVVGLGAVPVAMSANQSFESGVAPWLESALGTNGADVTRLDAADGAPLEAIAAAQPDLIVAGSADFDVAAVYDELSKIAPVVSYIDEPFTDSWQARTKLVGSALGRDEQAAAVVSQLESNLAGRSAAHPGWKGLTFTFGIHFGGSTRVITSPTDSTLLLFTQTFGLVLPAQIEALGDQLNGTADVALEQLNLLDADAVLLAYLSEQDATTLSSNPLYKSLPAVKDGRLQSLDARTATALREASILAIPFSADMLETALVASLGT